MGIFLLTPLNLTVFLTINVASLLKQIQLFHNKALKQLQDFTFILYVQEISDPRKHILAEVGIEVAMKPYFTLSSIC